MMVKETPTDMALGIYSDLYKDVNGFRPSGAKFETMEEYDAAMKRLQIELNEQEAWEEEIRWRNLVEFEEHIESLMVDHTIDRATALRWDMEAEDEEDIDAYLWRKRLPREDEARIREEFNES